MKYLLVAVAMGIVGLLALQAAPSVGSDASARELIQTLRKLRTLGDSTGAARTDWSQLDAGLALR